MNLFVIWIVVASGWFSRYDAGVMQKVITNRQSWGQLPTRLPEVRGYIAVLDCAKIGQVWTVRVGQEIERMLVVDCAGSQETRDWMRRHNILFEVDYETSLRWEQGERVEVVRKKAVYWRTE